MRYRHTVTLPSWTTSGPLSGPAPKGISMQTTSRPGAARSRRLGVLAVLIALTGMFFGGATATAVGTPTGSNQVTVAWKMPAYWSSSIPQQFPQTLAPGGVLPQSGCGWYQIDTYDVSTSQKRAAFDRIVSDGRLDQGEDLEINVGYDYRRLTNTCATTALDVTSVDVCETSEDTYTIPSQSGVRYVVDGVATPAGTYSTDPADYDDNGELTLSVRADAPNNGTLINTSETWTLTFTDESCGTATVVPVEPTTVDQCTVMNDAYTIPDVAGVRYEIDGETVEPGTYPGRGTVTITAVGVDGTVLEGITQWEYVFTAELCPEVPDET